METLEIFKLSEKTLKRFVSEIEEKAFHELFEYDYDCEGLNKDFFEISFDVSGILLVMDVMATYIIRRGDIADYATYTLFSIKEAYNEDGEEVKLSPEDCNELSKVIEKHS